jgi:hypothetical protein
MADSGLAELRELVTDLARSTRELRESQKKTERLLEQSKLETDQKLKELSSLFTGQWGKLVEALMRPGTVALFKERGVPVTQMTERREGLDAEGRPIEVDMTLVNEGTVVAVEIKTTCKVEDVNAHLDKLRRFRQAFREYATWKVQGAVAALRFEEDSDRYAYRRGLWVLKCQDGITRLANDPDFQPAVF